MKIQYLLEHFYVIFCSTAFRVSDQKFDNRNRSLINSAYNGGYQALDKVDQVANYYDVARVCKRWPVVYFYKTMNYCLANTLSGTKLVKKLPDDLNKGSGDGQRGKIYTQYSQYNML